MKKSIITSRKWLTVIYLIWSLIIIYAIIYFTHKYYKSQKETTLFKRQEIHSRIIELRNFNRGYFLIRVLVDKEYKSFDLPISYEVDKYKIIVGDSLSKKCNSDVIDIFRADRSGIHKICRIEI